MTMCKPLPSGHFISRALPAAPTAAVATDAWSGLLLPAAQSGRSVTLIAKCKRVALRKWTHRLSTSGLTSKEKMISHISSID